MAMWAFFKLVIGECMKTVTSVIRKSMQKQNNKRITSLQYEKQTFN